MPIRNHRALARHHAPLLVLLCALALACICAQAHCATSSCRRVPLTHEPFVNLSANCFERGTWPAQWIDHPARPQAEPSVCEFRLEFDAAAETTCVLHVSADNRYRLFVDDQPVGRGPERGDVRHWRFESYEAVFAPGKHTIVAHTWWLGGMAPYAQMSNRPGFLLAAEGALQPTLATGMATWQARILPEYEMTHIPLVACTGARVKIDLRRRAGGTDIQWTTATRVAQGMSARWKNEFPPDWLLTPATLPPMKEEPRTTGTVRHLADAATAYPVRAGDHLAGEADRWQQLFSGKDTLTVPANTKRRAIVDLGDYYCAYPELRVSGGRNARVRVQWAEGLYQQDQPGPKGNRDEIEGKYFIGAGDEFITDGGDNRRFTTPWWEAGRYLEVTVETDDEPLSIQSFAVVETGYPFEWRQKFRSSDPRLESVIPIMTRSLQMCSHETYMDCPYYEQLMYVGDTRLEALVTYMLTPDASLPRKALDIFDSSRLLRGFTQSRYPSRVTQIIPPFSLWYVCMVNDYAMWRDDPQFVRSLMPGVRQVMEAFRQYLREDGLMKAPIGWNFVDWVPSWPMGIPPDADRSPNAILNLQFVLALQDKARLEDAFGDAALAARDRATARRTFTAVLDNFLVKDAGLISDDPGHKHFSEHAQCLAILTGLLPHDTATSVAQQLLARADLARTTIYFSHYLFEALARVGRADTIIDRMELWFDLPKHGFKTTFEAPEPTRSDCHAWATHPLFHYHATLAGIRPASPGFRTVRVEPQPGPLQSIESVMPHPRGEIRAKLDRKGDGLAAHITLPPETTGTIAWNGGEKPLEPGDNRVEFP